MAILKLKQPRAGVTPLQIAAVQPDKGETCYAFGNPKGLSFSVSSGIVSALRDGTELMASSEQLKRGYELLGLRPDANWIQTTAPISAGNSGGPLIGEAGAVIGMNTWSYTTGQNLNFALDLTGLRLDRIAGAVQPLANLPQRPVANRAGSRPPELVEKTIRRIENISEIYSRRRTILDQASTLQEKITKLDGELTQARSKLNGVVTEGNGLLGIEINLQQQVINLSGQLTASNDSNEQSQLQQSIDQRNAQLQATRGDTPSSMGRLPKSERRAAESKTS